MIPRKPQPPAGWNPPKTKPVVGNKRMPTAVKPVGQPTKVALPVAGNKRMPTAVKPVGQPTKVAPKPKSKTASSTPEAPATAQLLKKQLGDQKAVNAANRKINTKNPASLTHVLREGSGYNSSSPAGRMKKGGKVKGRYI